MRCPCGCGITVAPGAPNPSGHCLCGCGEPTYVPRKSSAARGLVGGQHARYRIGHGRRGKLDPAPLAERLRCRCGCGELAPLAKRTSSRTGIRKGQALAYVPGHSGAGNKHRERRGQPAKPLSEGWKAYLRAFDECLLAARADVKVAARARMTERLIELAPGAVAARECRELRVPGKALLAWGLDPELRAA